MENAPAAVLLACNLNRVRSPIAARLLARMNRRIYVDSCGLHPAPDIDPFAAAVMAELGLDLVGHTPKTFEALEDASFDLVISLTPEAHARALELSRGRAMEAEYWPTPDPTRETGSREQRLAAYREVRDDLNRKLKQRFDPGSASQGSSLTDPRRD